MASAFNPSALETEVGGSLRGCRPLWATQSVNKVPAASCCSLGAASCGLACLSWSHVMSLVSFSFLSAGSLQGKVRGKSLANVTASAQVGVTREAVPGT